MNMRRKTVLSTSVLALVMAGTFTSCQKTAAPELVANNVLSQDEKSLVASAGFNSNWAEKTAEGNYLIEGDILLTTAQLKEIEGKSPSNNFIVADEEHYRTYNIVSAPTTGSRVITVR